MLIIIPVAVVMIYKRIYLPDITRNKIIMSLIGMMTFTTCTVLPIVIKTGQGLNSWLLLINEMCALFNAFDKFMHVLHIERLVMFIFFAAIIILLFNLVYRQEDY